MPPDLGAPAAFRSGGISIFLSAVASSSNRRHDLLEARVGQMIDKPFDAAAAIEAAYADFEFKNGWRFLYCPAERIKTAKLAIVGLNPGGRDDEGPYGGEWDCATNAYLHEAWGPDDSLDPLQCQIAYWYQLSGVEDGDSLCAQYVPFRSRDWAGLKNRQAVTAFSDRLWRWLIQETSARTFIAMGRVAGSGVVNALVGTGAAQLLETSYPTGWGSQKLYLRKFADGRRVITMPHPSRYRIFGREHGRSAIAEAGFLAALVD